MLSAESGSGEAGKGVGVVSERGRLNPVLPCVLPGGKEGRDDLLLESHEASLRDEGFSDLSPVVPDSEEGRVVADVVLEESDLARRCVELEQEVGKILVLEETC